MTMHGDEILAGVFADLEIEEDGSVRGYDEQELVPRVSSVMHADMCGRAIRAVEAEIEKVDALVSQQIEELTEWGQRQIEPLGRRVGYLRGVLERYHLAEKERLGAKAPKTIHLPSGDLELRAVPLSVEVTDAAAAVEVLEAFGLGHCVNRPPAPDPSPKKAEVKRVTERVQREDGSWGLVLVTGTNGTADGMEIPGLDASAPGDKVTFKPNRDEKGDE